MSSHENATPRAIRLELRCLINSERLRRGLPRLSPHGALSRAAGGHASDMVRRRYVAHNSPSGRTPAGRIARRGYLRRALSWRVGENIAWLQNVRDARWVVSAWLRSPAHRRILLARNFREVGLGVVKSSPHGDSRGMTVVADFGARTLRRPRLRRAPRRLHRFLVLRRSR